MINYALTPCERRQTCVKLYGLLTKLRGLPLRHEGADQLRKWRTTEGRQAMLRVEVPAFDAQFCQQGFRTERLKHLEPFVALFLQATSLRRTIDAYVMYLIKENPTLWIAKVANLDPTDQGLLTRTELEFVFYGTVVLQYIGARLLADKTNVEYAIAAQAGDDAVENWKRDVNALYSELLVCMRNGR